MAQILGVLERRPNPPSPASLQKGAPTAEFLHDYTEAARLAFADRAHYLGDPDFAKPPGGHWETLVASEYLDRRARRIGEQSIGRAGRGDPTATDEAAPNEVPEESAELPSTSHLSVVDAEGKAVALSSSIEDAFGSRMMVRGFMLNNQLTDFSFVPGSGVSRRANRVEAGKRPRSSMAPTLVFDKSTGKLVMSVGSPGGAQLIHYTAKTVLGVLAMGLDVQQAIDLPNFGSTNGPTELELASIPQTTIEALRQRGHEVRERNLVSGVQALVRTANGWQGGADRRREGQVLGE